MEWLNDPEWRTAIEMGCFVFFGLQTGGAIREKSYVEAMLWFCVPSAIYVMCVCMR